LNQPVTPIEKPALRVVCMSGPELTCPSFRMARKRWDQVPYFVMSRKLLKLAFKTAWFRKAAMKARMGIRR